MGQQEGGISRSRGRQAEETGRFSHAVNVRRMLTDATIFVGRDF
jgi:hypothetical protein